MNRTKQASKPSGHGCLEGCLKEGILESTMGVLTSIDLHVALEHRSILRDVIEAL